MSRDIPFFEMFTELQLSGELRLPFGRRSGERRLHRPGRHVAGAGASPPGAELGDAELEELKHLLMGVYGFRQVTTEVTCKAPSSQAAARREPPGCFGPGGPLRQ